jgi:hypothetical protein
MTPTYQNKDPISEKIIDEPTALTLKSIMNYL